ncbi:hypothetical protein WA158_007104 [Blastocystis sp. Blastoise]
MPPSLYSEALSDILLEYFEVYIHQILFYSKLYPKELFERSVKYNTLTMMCRHPELNEYIYKFVQSLKDWLLDGSLSSFDILIYNNIDEIVETFKLKIESLAVNLTDVIDFDKIRSSMRSSILRISLSEQYYKQLSSECTFRLQVERHMEKKIDNKIHQNMNQKAKMKLDYSEIKKESTSTIFTQSIGTIYTPILSMQILCYT